MLLAPCPLALFLEDAPAGVFFEQAKLRKVATDAARWDEDTMKKEEADSVQILTAMGYTFTRAKPEEIARAVDAMKPYWDEWAKSRGPDVVEALTKVRAALGR